MTCVICGGEQHRDEEGYICRCPDAQAMERIPAHVYLRELGRTE